MVLCGAAHHRRTTDVDLLDAALGSRTRRNRRGERVQVADQQIERLDTELGNLHAMRLQPQIGKQAGVDHRVQRLDPTVQAFGESGDFLDGGDRQSRLGDLLRRRARGDDLRPGVHQSTCDAEQVGLVIDRDQCALYGSSAVVIPIG
jgi:hypothetical protein